jgi:hypothetical protein
MIQYLTIVILCSAAFSQLSVGAKFNSYVGVNNSLGTDNSFAFVLDYNIDLDWIGILAQLSHDNFQLRPQKGYVAKGLYLEGSIFAAKKMSNFSILFGWTLAYKLSSELVSSTTSYFGNYELQDIFIHYNVGLKYSLRDILNENIAVSINYKFPLIHKTLETYASSSSLDYSALSIGLLYEFD